MLASQEIIPAWPLVSFEEDDEQEKRLVLLGVYASITNQDWLALGYYAEEYIPSGTRFNIDEEFFALQVGVGPKPEVDEETGETIEVGPRIGLISTNPMLDKGKKWIIESRVRLKRL